MYDPNEALRRLTDIYPRPTSRDCAYRTQKPSSRSISSVRIPSHVSCLSSSIIEIARLNVFAVYTLAQELYPGQFRPTITHSFLKLLFSHNLLYRCFTQNIDTLEIRAGVPAYKIIHAHGSFASQQCIDCGQPYDSEKMKDHIMRKEIAYCDKCRGLVKPDIVFFGENVRSSPSMLSTSI